MSVVPEDLVEQTWHEMAALTPDQFDQVQALTTLQPALLAFVVAMTEDLSRPATELGIYMYNVILRMFLKHAPKKVRRVIKPSRVERMSDRNDELMERLLGAHERFFERTALVETSRQPFVMKYVVETLMEAPQFEDDAIPLTEDEQGMLFLVLKTVVDTLDEAIQR